MLRMRSSHLNAYLVVMVGGSIGSAIRYYAYTLLGARPFTTFAVNIAGSFLIGLLAATMMNTQMRLFLGTGLLGGFTTFSAWQLEALLESHKQVYLVSLLTILFGSLAAGYAACWIGYSIGQRLYR